MTTHVTDPRQLKNGDRLTITVTGIVRDKLPDGFFDLKTDEGKTVTYGPNRFKASTVERLAKPLPQGLGAIVTVHNGIKLLTLVRVGEKRWQVTDIGVGWNDQSIHDNGGPIDVLSEGTIL